MRVFGCRMEELVFLATGFLMSPRGREWERGERLTIGDPAELRLLKESSIGEGK